MTPFSGTSESGTEVNILERFETEYYEEVLAVAPDLLLRAREVSDIVGEDTRAIVDKSENRKSHLEKASEKFMFKASDKIIADTIAEADRWSGPIEETLNLTDWASFEVAMGKRSAVDMHRWCSCGRHC